MFVWVRFFVMTEKDKITISSIFNALNHKSSIYADNENDELKENGCFLS